MKKKLFLTGPDRSGKSDMIHSALGEHIRRAGGFVTIRERDEQGNVLSFDLMPADGSGHPERFWELVNGKPMSRMEVFAQSGTRLLRQGANRPFVVLDDPFVNFDKQNFKSAIDLLKKLSQNTQVVYLTCWDRFLNE